MNVDRGGTARSMFWSAIENGGLAAVSFLSLILYSRLLSTADFGLFSIVFALIELLNLPVGMLFHDALVQRQHVTDLHYDTAFSFTLALSVVIAAVCWVLAPTLGVLIHQPDAGPILSWMSLTLPLGGVSTTIVARQRRAFDFRALALRSLVGRLLGALAGIATALAGIGLWSLVVQQLTMALVGSIVLWLACDARPLLRFKVHEFKQLILFGGISVTTVLLSFAVKRGYTILVGISLGSSDAGVLNLSFRVVDMFWALAAAIPGQVAFPMLARLQTDRERLKSAYQQAVAFTCIVLFPCFAGLAATSPEVINMLFGSKWLPSAASLTALSFLVLTYVPRLFVEPLLTAVGRPQAPLYWLAIQMVFMVMATALFGVSNIPMAVGIWIACTLISIPVSAWMLYKYVGLTFDDQLKGVSVPFAATALMLAAIVVVRFWLPQDLGAIIRLSVFVPIGAAVFCITLYFLDRELATNAINFIYTGVSPKKKIAGLLRKL